MGFLFFICMLSSACFLIASLGATFATEGHQKATWACASGLWMLAFIASMFAANLH